nr:cystathionine gamma-lyase-like isoform X1 [Pogona vitticeps]XP_020650918.1 cystathionine gamma-lyase-like isoform X1 [Pogona vitticeps]XP_020650919.1 cystathionine gamma-lyase-like isoform X1 [Pogona vitticeps]XP_020650921.1 cystathionine gamma-lyase-like isoform X2 [Pogona vitticeps]
MEGAPAEPSRGFLPPFRHFATQAIHVGQEPEQWNSLAVVPPISLATTFKQHAPGKHSGFEYSRCGNPTRDCLEKAVAVLDGAKYCLAYASGTAATLNIAHLLKAGDTVICTVDVYGGTDTFFRKIASDMGLNTVFVDCTKLECLEAAITPETKLVWIEVATNPTLKFVDIQACAKIVHKHEGVILAVDNTFMSAYFQRPLALGADICMCSATKYMNGHTDVVMGLVSVNDDALHEKLRFLQCAIGAVPSPFECYLCNRGLKTLAIRMKQHFQNALAVAQFLESNPRVEKVIFPGLPSHPQFELVKRQCTGCPGMVSFYIKGNAETASTFLKSLKLFTLAVSLGGYESLAEHPAIMTHASVPKADREALGITDTFIRMSVGLEDSEDLLEDLSQALKAAIPDYKIRN